MKESCYSPPPNFWIGSYARFFFGLITMYLVVSKM
jgi:hypothetical protein